MTAPYRPLQQVWIKVIDVIDGMVRSPVNYWAKLVTDLTVPVVFLTLGLDVLAATPVAGAGVLAGGFLSHGFIEYAVHRFILHGPPSVLQRGHAQHHADPDAMISSPFFVVLIAILLLWTTFRLVLPVGVAALLVTGVYAGYGYYGVMHHLQHHHRTTLDGLTFLRALERAHHRHHDRFRVNFGISTIIWDRTFGTYDPTEPVSNRPASS